IVHLTNAIPSEVVPSITPFSKMPQGIVPIDSSGILVIRDYANNVKRMMEVIKKIDVYTEPEYKLEIIPIKYGKVEDIYNVMSGLVGGGGGAAPGARPTTRRTATSSRMGGLGGRGGIGQRYNQPGTMQPQAQPGAASAQSSFAQRLQQIVRSAGGGSEQILSEGTKIIPDERSNSLVVYATRPDMQMLTNIVGQLDVALAQVLIEAVIVNVTLNDSLSLGVSAVQNPKSSGKFTGASGINNGQSFLSSFTNSFSSGLPNGLSLFGTWAGDLEVAVNALSSSGSASVLQRPRIQTTHAVPASFFNGQTVPYITSTYYGYGYGGGPSSSYQQLSVGVELDVTPYITPDGLVVMEIEQTIDELAGYTQIGPDQVPNTTSRTATSTVSVKSGETIILGGFMRTTKSKSNSGVPILKDIPLLGVLFRSSSSNSERSELIVLIRPTVLHTPHEAALAAENAEKSLPGVRMAEKEFQESENKLQAETEKKLKKKKGTGNTPEGSHGVW
ncbi:MAG: hypothetical protein M1608_11045, partial [Candidatus Omnitrophica bacterium]|nr:hypothetical protein [Candidatus Omnitrophota bacterium]